MPTHRRRRFRRGSRRRAGLASRVKKIIGRMVQQEFKVFDTSVSGDTGSGAPLVVALNDISQGSNINNRAGDGVIVRSIGLRGYVSHPTATNPPFSQALRIMLVQDRFNQTAGTAPTFTNVLGSAATYAYKELAAQDPQRFKILWSKFVFLKQDATGVAAGSSAVNGFTFDKYWRLPRGINVHFTGTGASTYSSNSLYFMAVSNLTTAGGSAGIAGICRLRFTDS